MDLIVDTAVDVCMFKSPEKLWHRIYVCESLLCSSAIACRLMHGGQPFLGKMNGPHTHLDDLRWFKINFNARLLYTFYSVSYLQRSLYTGQVALLYVLKSVAAV